MAFEETCFGYKSCSENANIQRKQSLCRVDFKIV